MAFSNFTLPISQITVIPFLVICLISYYFIFKEHHKKNEMKFHEIYPLVINYLILCIISFLVLIFGIDRVITGYVYNDEIYEVIQEFITGFAIISIVIINFIFYIKKHKQDLVQEEREEEEKKTTNIAEIIELVLLIAMFIIPIFNIFKYINFIDKTEQIRQIFGGVLFMVISVFLMFSLNPLDIKGKIKNLFKKDINKDKSKEE